MPVARRPFPSIETQRLGAVSLATKAAKRESTIGRAFTKWFYLIESGKKDIAIGPVLVRSGPRQVLSGFERPAPESLAIEFVHRITNRVNGYTYASSVTTIPTSAARAIEWKKT